MKSMETEMQVLNDIDTVVYSAFSWITPSDGLKWIQNSAVYKKLSCNVKQNVRLPLHRSVTLLKWLML